MPGRDGTGPIGNRMYSGRGLNANNNRVGYGFSRRGSRGGYFINQNESNLDKDSLIEQKKLYENRLDIINKQLKELSEDNS